ncbi:MAG: hypothetical protein KDJ36_18135, partial [Hyphomicrobiaceae bacterium]|nr:hypothetical protein [Hyphomicrobiaceae bacterium]
AFAAALGHCESYQSLTAPLPVVIRAMSTVARMSLYGVLGILSQQWQADLAHYEFFAVYGFVPGCILAAGFVAVKAHVFEKANWRRSRESNPVSEGQVSKVRPGSLSQLYSVALLLGPAVTCAGVPFGVYPTPFLLTALPFLAVQHLGERFWHQREDDLVLAGKTYALAGVATVLVLFAGVLARYGF